MVKTKQESYSLEKMERFVTEGKFSPVYLFYGEEDFLIEEAVGFIVDKALESAARNFNFDLIHGSDSDSKDIVPLITSYPMMSERRVVVVKEFDRLPNKDLLVPFIVRPVESTVLILTAVKPDLRLKIYKAIEEHSVTAEYRHLPDYKIPEWIGRRISKYNKEATPEACELLHAHVGNSLREIQNEIDKLIVYAAGKEVINESDVDAVVGISRRYNIFELQKKIGEKDIASAQQILERMLDSGEYAVLIVSMLTKYFRKLWIIWDLFERKVSRSDLIQFLKIRPKQLSYFDQDLGTAKKFTLQDLENSFEVLVDADEKLKSTTQDPRLVMTTMLVKLIRGREPG